MAMVRVHVNNLKRFLDGLSDRIMIKSIHLSGNDYVIIYAPVGGR